MISKKAFKTVNQLGSVVESGSGAHGFQSATYYAQLALKIDDIRSNGSSRSRSFEDEKVSRC